MRLTDPERRVLWALFSFRGKDTNIVWPSLDSLAERSLIKDKTRISKLTKSLSEKGWLTKKKRGFTGGNTYTLTVPSNLDSGAKLEDAPNMDENTNSNLDSDTNSNLDSDTKCKEQSIEQSIEQSNKDTPAKPKKVKKQKTYLPENFALTDAMRVWFLGEGFIVDIHQATETWKDSMTANGNQYIDWQAAWKNGMRRADGWARDRSPQQTQNKSTGWKEFG